MASDDSRLKPFPLWQKAALFGAAYFVCAVGGSYLTARGGTFVSFWLPAGLTTAVLLLSRTRDWPWFLLAAFPANFAFDFVHDPKPNFTLVFLFYCSNVVQSAVGAWLVRKFVAERPTLATLKEFFGIVFFAAMFGSMLGAFIGAGALVHFGFSQSFGQSLKIWWGSNAMAVLVLTPFILTWFSKPSRVRKYFDRPNKIAEAALLLLGLGSFAWYLLTSDKGVMSPNKSLLIPLLLWAGLRFGVRGATAANLFLSVTLAFFTAQFFYGLTPAQIASGEYVFVMQMALAMTSLMALIPAIVVSERERTLAELRESEERFKNLSEAAFEGIFISENGWLLDVNEQGLKMFGYKRGEIIGKQISELIAPESRATVTEAIRAGQETIYGHQLLHKDGSIFFGETQARMVRAGNKTLRMTALRDITESKRAEEALRNSEALFRSYFEMAAVGCAISSLEKGIFAVNDQFCQMLGYSVEELKKMTWVQFTHPDDVADDVEHFNRVLAGEIDSYTMDKRYIRKDGREVFVTLSVRCVRRPDGTPDYFVGLVMDITERKRAEKALRESEEKFSKAFQASPDGICITELKTGRFMEVNEGYCRLFHYSREELIGHSTVELGIFENSDIRERFVNAVLAQGSVRDMEFSNYRRDGQKRLVQISAERIDLGIKPCVVSVVHDITDRNRAEFERAEAQSREAQARAEYTFQLIASQEAERTRIARELHDSLGQNLLLIKNRAQLEMVKTKLPVAVRDEFQSISDLASQAIAEVRQIARDLHPHQLDILGLTRALRALIDNIDESSEMTIDGKFDLADDLFPREAATNIYRIVQESLNNVLKHSRAKKARITLERDVHEVQLRIEDDGCGFKTGKDDDGAKGLGLRNIAERVRMLGGKIKLDSQPDKGTRIEITIPISAEHG
jgi:PAS domain S-box-containing protein